MGKKINKEAIFLIRLWSLDSYSQKRSESADFKE